MEQKKLVKISLIIALLSIFIILLLALNLEPKITKIKDIDKKSLDEWVKIHGRVLDVEKFKSNDSLKTLTLIKIDDYTGSIIVVFRRDIKEIRFGQNIEVLGKITEYKDNLEIEASKIKILSE